MSVQNFEQWAQKLAEHCKLDLLKDAVIGVDASYYLNLRLNNDANDEPLKPALGGTPFVFRKTIEEDIAGLRQHGINLVFVFNGLDYVNKSVPEQTTNRFLLEGAWHHYLEGDGKRTVTDFGKATYHSDGLTRALQKILAENNVEYMVAPYSAVAQLSYLFSLDEQYIDAVMSSTEAFLFDVDRVVTDFNVNDAGDAPLSLSMISSASCAEALKINKDMLRDAQLLLGNSFIPTFPILETMATTKTSVDVMDAVNMLNGANKSVITLCGFHEDNAQVNNLKYADRYKKAIMTIRHHVVVEKNGVVRPLRFDEAPGDVHEFVGQQLPEELIFYLSKGMLSPRIPNWLISPDGIVLSLPGGVLDSEPYRRLVIESLMPLRRDTLKILADPLYHYYGNKKIDIIPWTNQDTTDLKVELRQIAAWKPRLSPWKIRGANVEAIVNRGEHKSFFLPCLQSLKDSGFAAKTISANPAEVPALSTADEVAVNTIFRFLHVRGYIDDQHKLTTWGRALEAALAIADEEHTVVGIEMLRLGLFTGNFATGTPVSKSDKNHDQKVNTNLISKVSCLGRIRHKPVGFVGPLDQQLLTFAEKITAVRIALRDLLEAVMTSMFLHGDVERDRDDWVQLVQRLPLVSDHGSAMGIMAKTYLDALNKEPEINDTLKTTIKQQEGDYQWFGQLKGSGYLTKSLDGAWKFWDAIYAATKVSGTNVKEAKLFAEANEWLSPRR